MTNRAVAALALRGFYALLPHLVRWSQDELEVGAQQDQAHAVLYRAVIELRTVLNGRHK